jgi:putative flippase GtrA
MRTRGAGFADTIPYPVFLKSTLLDVGAYNTQLHRNQDNDLNQRLRARGNKLYITDKTSCEYFVSPDLASLAGYAFKNGFWNIISFKVNPASMSLRHFVPGAFVLILLLSSLALLYSVMTHTQTWLLAPILLLSTIYGVASIGVSCHIALRERSMEALLMPITFLLLHVFYGAGTLAAVMSNARSPSS